MQFTHRKKFDFIFISQRVIIAIFLFLLNYLKPGIFAHPLKNKHTRLRAYTRTGVHMYAHLSREHARALANAQTHTQIHAARCKRTHLHTDAQVYECTRERNARTRANMNYSSANARMQAQTYTCIYEHTCAHPAIISAKLSNL